jgi:Mg2+ and Co2+ transporter CorA
MAHLNQRSYYIVVASIVSLAMLLLAGTHLASAQSNNARMDGIDTSPRAEQRNNSLFFNQTGDGEDGDSTNIRRIRTLSTTSATSTTSIIDRHEARQERRAELKTRLDEQKRSLKTDMEERRTHFSTLREESDGTQDRKVRDEEARLDRVEAFFERIFRRLSAAFERLATLADRIESRIVKLEEKGFNLEQASEAIATARAELVGIPEQIDQARSMMSELLTSENKRDTYQAIKSTLREISSSIRRVHALLVGAIRNIKANVDIAPSSGDETNDTDDDTGADDSDNTENNDN